MEFFINVKFFSFGFSNYQEVIELKKGDVLYFSPKHKFINLDWNDKEKLTDAFKDRVGGFYLHPAKILNERQYAFAVGTLCTTIIDFLARIEFGLDKTGERIKKWLLKYIPECFNDNLAERFYREFRNGLVHEGRIKRCGQFSYDHKEELIHLIDDVLIINPNLLLGKIIKAFDSYLKEVKTDEFKFQQLRCALIRDFQEDVECAKE